MLELKHISKYYGNKMAVRDISFSIRQGQVVGLLGHNGCGKTTTMSIITNCIAPSEGEVFVCGIPVIEHPVEAKAKIGYLPEVPPLYPDMTVDEQLDFACGLRKIPGRCREEEISRACEDLNISGVRKRLIHNLSKGYRQRVGFAQALIGRPPLLVLDEPTVGLDPQQIIEIRELIVRLKEDHTLIVSSHFLSEIAHICDRVVILSSGRLAADDTLDGLIEKSSEYDGILLRADGERERICEIVGNLPGVKSCSVRPGGADGETEYRIETLNHRDIHRELFEALSEADMPIRMMKPLRAGLEEIFLRLTQDRRYEWEEGEHIN